MQSNAHFYVHILLSTSLEPANLTLKTGLVVFDATIFYFKNICQLNHTRLETICTVNENNLN